MSFVWHLNRTRCYRNVVRPGRNITNVIWKDRKLRKNTKWTRSIDQMVHTTTWKCVKVTGEKHLNWKFDTFDVNHVIDNGANWLSFILSLFPLPLWPSYSICSFINSIVHYPYRSIYPDKCATHAIYYKAVSRSGHHKFYSTANSYFDRIESKHRIASHNHRRVCIYFVRCKNWNELGGDNENGKWNRENDECSSRTLHYEV